MLSKSVYSKVVQGLKRIKILWDEDRAEDPNRVPYEIDNQLRDLIESSVREGHMNYNGRRDMDLLVGQTIKYLIEKGLIIGSPYGGTMFPLPPDAKPLPSKREFIADTRAKLDKIYRESYSDSKE